MKTTFKLSSLMGSLLVAFAITMFMPSALQATWGNYNSNDSSSSSSSKSSSSDKSKKCYTKKSTKYYSSKSSSSHSSSSKSKASNSSSSKGKGDASKYKKYKALASKYLKLYYKCYNYKYYKKYVYYTKKAKACKPAVTVDCNKYKVLADKYLAAYYKCGYYCYYRYYQYYMGLYNKCQANQNQTGKVCGKVFEDTNENGKHDSSDARLGNVTVKITDSKGKVTTVTTNKYGYYCASGIATGAASVDIDETTLPDNPTQVVGTDPTDVEVKANTKNWEENNGFVFPAPTGNVCGVVYEDKNGNGQQDSDETGVADIDVTIIDANGDTHTVTTDVDGKYCLSDVPEGSASVTVVESTLPNGATLTAGENPSDVTVEANKNNDAGKDGYTLPTPVGNVCGTVLVDGQGQKDVKVELLDSEGMTHTVTTDADGKYCFTDIPQGAATVDIVDSTLPDGAEQTAGEDPSDVNVLANENNDAGIDEYTLPIPVGAACGTVLVDGKGESNVTVNIVDVNGDTHTVTTDADGKYCATDIPEGDATVTVDETTLPAGVTQVVGDNPNTISVVANENNDAGIDGYETPVVVGNVCGLVLVDGVGQPGVTVNIVDVNGDMHTITTGSDGKYCLRGINEGDAIVTVDEDTLPEDVIQVGGVNPNTTSVVAGQNNDAGTDSYETIVPGVCPTGFDSYDQEIWSRGNADPVWNDTGLQTELPITFPDDTTGIRFVNVHTFEEHDIEQPYEQFKIVAVDNQGHMLDETIYTTDINNPDVPVDVYSDLGTLSVSTNTSKILLVHRADSVYGDNLTFSNSVYFKGLCYRLETK